MNSNDTVLTKWNDSNIDPNATSIIFIMEDGSYLYGKINKEMQNWKNRIGHLDIFEKCVDEIGISIPGCDNQMDYAWGLASDDNNIITMQIAPKIDIICILNVKSTDEQLEKLYYFVDFFSKTNLFNADVIYNGGEREMVNNEPPKDAIIKEFGLSSDDFKFKLDDTLKRLKAKIGHLKR